MLMLILAAAAALTPLDKLVDAQMRVGLCEAHLRADRVAFFDPYASTLPRPVQDTLQQARVEGRRLAVQHPLRKGECQRVLNELLPANQ